MDRKAFARTTAIGIFFVVFALGVVFFVPETQVSASGENWWNSSKKVVTHNI